MFLVTSAVSICGPIGFISLGVPNLSRILCAKTDIRYHYLISSAMGIGLLLITWLVVTYASFGVYLPVSATMASKAVTMALALQATMGRLFLFIGFCINLVSLFLDDAVTIGM